MSSGTGGKRFYPAIQGGQDDLRAWKALPQLDALVRLAAASSARVDAGTVRCALDRRPRSNTVSTPSSRILPGKLAGESSHASSERRLARFAADHCDQRRVCEWSFILQAPQQDIEIEVRRPRTW